MIKDLFKITGEATITVCDMSSPEAQELQNKIVKARGTEYRSLMNELHSKFMKRQIVIKNLCPTVGRTVLARLLSGDATYTGEINYCALGTDDTASANGNTQLGVEVFRKLVSSATYSANIAYFSTFFTATETANTYKEVGHFIDGTPTVNTGQLFSRIADPETAELPLTKSVTESLTVDYRITLS